MLCESKRYRPVGLFRAEVGLLLARMHRIFWDKIHILPKVFHRRHTPETPTLLIAALAKDVCSLDERSAAIVREEIGISSELLLPAVCEIEAKISCRTVGPPTVCCTEPFTLLRSCGD